MFALKIVVATALAVACNALALSENASVVEARGVKCNFGQPINATTITLDNGAEVQSWGCKLSSEEIAAKHAEIEAKSDFKFGTFDSRDLSVADTSLTKRQYNACGISCTTYCETPAGGGPDPNDCSALASGWTSGTFTVPAWTSWFFSLGSCEVRVNNLLYNGNRSNGGLTYCWNDLRGVTNYVAWNCQATQNAHGGYCLMNNGWDIGSIDVNACCS